MRNRQASRTAEYMAFFRALESQRPSDQRLFHDPFAVRFLRPALKRVVSLSAAPAFSRFVNWYADRRLPGARTSAIARTRFIDDEIRRAFQLDLPQLVILGSGFDCRAYRLPELQRATIFEIDHPDTLDRKLHVLHAALPSLPSNVRFVAADFQQQALPAVLSAAGFRVDLPALFLWEGVTNYLTAESVDSVLHYVGSCTLGTQLIFTYIDAAVLDGSTPFYGATRLLRDVHRVGEPWIFGLRPVNVPTFLRQRGFGLDCDLSAAEYRAAYWGSAAQKMRGYEFYHVAVAHVLPAPERCESANQSLGQEASNA